MKLDNIHGFGTIDEYVRYKLNIYMPKEKNFETLFQMMFDEQDNIMVETTDGYRIKKTTYGDVKKEILAAVPTIQKRFADVPAGKMIGLYMANCPQWLVAFWAILGAGYCPLLMNTRLSDGVLEDILEQYGVGGVISDGKMFRVPTVLKDQALAPAGEEPVVRPFGKEVLFMSSGTSDKVKICAYTGENFYYQICDSANIVATCPDITRHYEGQLKHLVLLPLCHVFGFIAVYLWFGFFSRTFVFPKDLDPATIQKTVKKHKVTHIFAVPMVWEAVAKAATGKIKSRGEKTYNRFLRAMHMVNSTGKLGDTLARKLLSEVREGLFGDSIQFMISGGSEINPATLEFFNGIGYHLANGYGMTEIGITSVEKASSRKILNIGSIGAPFGYTEYSIDEKGCLLVRGKTRASRILCHGSEAVAEDDVWFNTGDMMRREKGRYFTQGRSDDLIIGADGENLNPLLAENALQVAGIDRVCVFEDKGVTVVASVPGCYTPERITALYEKLVAAAAEAKLDKVISRIWFTGESLLAPADFKVSRKKIAQRIRDGQLQVFDPANIREHSQQLLEGLQKDLRDLFAQVLDKDPQSIGADTHFFRDLGGTSMDYYTLLGLIKDKIGVQVITAEGEHFATVRQFADYLQDK